MFVLWMWCFGSATIPDETRYPDLPRLLGRPPGRRGFGTPAQWVTSSMLGWYAAGESFSSFKISYDGVSMMVFSGFAWLFHGFSSGFPWLFHELAVKKGLQEHSMTPLPKIRLLSAFQAIESQCLLPMWKKLPFLLWVKTQYWYPSELKPLK